MTTARKRNSSCIISSVSTVERSYLLNWEGLNNPRALLLSPRPKESVCLLPMAVLAPVLFTLVIDLLKFQIVRERSPWLDLIMISQINVFQMELLWYPLTYLMVLLVISLMSPQYSIEILTPWSWQYRTMVWVWLYIMMIIYIMANSILMHVTGSYQLNLTSNCYMWLFRNLSNGILMILPTWLSPRTTHWTHNTSMM